VCVQKTPGQTWNVVDSVWIEAWLHYVHLGENYPRPGPCRNDRLVELHVSDNEDSNEWHARQGMQMAVPSRKGDYRRVHPNTWKAIKEVYPGSGPDITMVYTYEERLAETGAYDTSSWVITPDEHMIDVHKRKKKRKLLANLSPFKGLGKSSRNLSGKSPAGNKENTERLISTDSDAPPHGLDDGRDESGSNDPILPNASHAPDSDDDEEAHPYEDMDKREKGDHQCVILFVVSVISDHYCSSLPVAISPMKKVMMARTFLGANAANDSGKDAGTYSKVTA
jgi:hypothetical protein